MNIYEEQGLEQKLDEITDQMGNLILDIILTSVRQAAQQYQTYEELADAKRPDLPHKHDPF
jgi:hypothetical protein